MVLKVVEEDALFQVGLGLAQLSQVEEVLPQGIMGFHQKGGVSHVLSEREDQLPELPHGLVFRPDNMKLPQASQHREELRTLPGLLTQLPCARVGFLHLRGRVALGGYQSRTKGDL